MASAAVKRIHLQTYKDKQDNLVKQCIDNCESLAKSNVSSKLSAKTPPIIIAVKSLFRAGNISAAINKSSLSRLNSSRK